MATHTLKTTRSTTIVMHQGDETWIIAGNGKIATPDIGIDAYGAETGRKIVVNGEIHATGIGISFGDMLAAGGGQITIGKQGLVEGDDTAIVTRGNGQIITNNGSIQGLDGIDSHGKNVLFTNNGDIAVSNSGFAIQSGSGKIVNTGTISGESGIYVPNVASFVIENSGLITGSKNAVEFQDLGKHEVHNTGVLKGDVFFGDSNDLLENLGPGVMKGGEIDLGGGDDHFVNTGRLVEKLAMGEGNDVVDLRGSKATAAIYGEQGNDTYLIDDVSQEVFENPGEGKDTIKTTIGFSLDSGVNGEIENLRGLGHDNIALTGNELNNALVCNAGANHLDGGLGTDMLIGGKGADVFVFATGYGHDTIKDFHPGDDRIDLSGWSGFDSFKDVKMHLAVDGDNLVISDMTDELVLRNVDKADLHAGDFIFT